MRHGSVHTIAKIYNFNSRTHVECDLAPIGGKVGIEIISTHALTWSATLPIMGTGWIFRNFNSRTHVECDAKTGMVMRLKKIISTHALTWSATAML